MSTKSAILLAVSILAVIAIAAVSVMFVNERAERKAAEAKAQAQEAANKAAAFSTAKAEALAAAKTEAEQAVVAATRNLLLVKVERKDQEKKCAELFECITDLNTYVKSDKLSPNQKLLVKLDVNALKKNGAPYLEMDETTGKPIIPENLRDSVSAFLNEEAVKLENREKDTEKILVAAQAMTTSEGIQKLADSKFQERYEANLKLLSK